jgi:hypothetical protein
VSGPGPQHVDAQAGPVEGQGQALDRRQPDPQPCERAGTHGHGQGLQGADPQPRVAEQALDSRQQRPGVILLAVDRQATVQLRALQQGHAAAPAAGVEAEDQHALQAYTSAAWRSAESES